MGGLESPGRLTVDELARSWAEVASQTTYLPMSGEEIERLLRRLINRLVAAIAAPHSAEPAGIEVAAELVAHDLTGRRSIDRSIEILGDGLPRLAECQGVYQRDAAVLRVVGALANGYAEALRQRTFDEQELLNQALLRAKQDAERRLLVCQARFRGIFFRSAVGIAISDLDGALVDVNPAFADIVGRAPQDLVGMRLPELLQADADPTLGEFYRKLVTRELASFRHRHPFTAASGELAWTYLVGTLLHDADGKPTHHMTIVEDITELQLLQQELSDQALHDRLTGLPNEHYFMSHLQHVLEGTDPSAQITLCRVNLDSFAVINDGIGRATGEQLLRSVAGRLQGLVSGQRAMVARMGTDDFAILIEDETDKRDISAFAASINDKLAEPVYVDDRGIAVSAGVGVVRRHAGRISPGELIRAADATLHRVKRGGRGQWGLYDGEHDARQRERYQLAAEIPGAWESGEIELQFQPVRRLEDGRIVALQALLRWDRPDGTVVDHSECLELAEQTGLVVSLGRWMVRTACEVQIQVSNCRQERAPRLRVDLTSALSQDPDLVAVVNDALSATGLRADQLRVGVPVEGLARGRGDVVDNVGTLADLGVEVVLLGAAAGPGYLAYLEDLPVGAVQVAADIVARIARRPGDDSVVARAVRDAIPLVRSAGATVIVPGVDTVEQAQWWRDGGADTAWGAHFGPPVRPHQLPTLLADL